MTATRASDHLVRQVALVFAVGSFGSILVALALIPAVVLARSEAASTG
jgi:hypothetical protein